MTAPTITAVQLGPGRGRPLLVLGPSLGTSVTELWREAAEILADDFDVVGWDLPGHGTNPAVGGGPLTMADLAEGVLSVVEDLRDLRDDHRPFFYAGVSTGGSVGLQLALDHPDQLATVAVICSGARIGTHEMWSDRAASVRAGGTSSLVVASESRWFAPGFSARQPELSERLLQSLVSTTDEGYARTCEALATFDVADRLADIDTPLLTIAGAEDVATPPASLEAICAAVSGAACSVTLPDVAHLAPAEAPAPVARAMLSFFSEHPVPTVREAVATP